MKKIVNVVCKSKRKTVLYCRTVNGILIKILQNVYYDQTSHYKKDKHMFILQ